MAGLDALATKLAALDNRHRLRIVAVLQRERMHVSELARRIGISRPLLYMHLEKLEQADLIRGTTRLEGQKAMKYLEVRPFDIRLTPKTIAAAEGPK